MMNWVGRLTLRGLWSLTSLEVYGCLGVLIRICRFVGEHSRVNVSNANDCQQLLEHISNNALTPNAKNIKIPKNNPIDADCTLNFVEIGNDFVKVLNDTDSHRYLGRLLCTSASDRMKIKIRK